MTREEYIDEFIDHLALEIKQDHNDNVYLEPMKVFEIVEYRLQWLFDNYTFIEKEK